MLAALLPSAAFAQSAPAPATPSAAPATKGGDIVVIARRLDAARDTIQPSLGASSYAISQQAIQALPGGDNQQFNQLILQAPGVAQDGFGQVHIRDDHGNLQYRINGVILPEGLSVFGQTLSPRLIDHFDLLTGALPAQYGLNTAGVIDVTTKSGFQDAGSVSLYGGSHGTIEPSVEYGGHSGNTNYFFSVDYKHDDLGIENVNASAHAIHDATDQFQGFAYVDHVLDAENRISFVGGYSNQWFQIPDPNGLNADATGMGYDLNGQTSFLSNNLNETQLERTGFGQVAWLHDAGNLTLQSAVSTRYSALSYRPDVTGELLFNGIAQAAFKSDLALVAQVDGAWKLGLAHTLRFGLFAQHDHTLSDTATAVFPDGEDVPETILDNSTANAWTTSAYLQDEWKLSTRLTLNYGARYDRYAAYRTEDQLSPRVNVVWKHAGTTVHAGYARYFTPPPFELVADTTITRFAGTSGAAPAGALDTTPYAERQNYFDVGFQQKIGRALTLGVDGYYRISKNLIDEGQFGAPIILTPFNYAKGRVRGVEFTGSYQHGPWMLYGNFAIAKAQGEDIVSSQFNFSAQELAYIANHYIYLDHDQHYTGSGGITYTVRDGGLKGLKLGGDLIYGSGLRADLPLPDGGDVPNGAELPGYAQVNLSTSYKLPRLGVEVRLDVINALDHAYVIRDGTGVGVGAPEYGPRRGFFVGLSKDI